MKKVASGQPLRIPAADYNAMVDAARAHQASRQSTSTPAGSGMPLGKKGDLLQHNGARFVRLAAPTAAFLETDSPGDPQPAGLLFMPDTMLWEPVLTTQECG